MEDLVTGGESRATDDAQAVARVYIDSWHDTYPAILPTELLARHDAQRADGALACGDRGRRPRAGSGRGMSKHGVVGMTSFGPAQDRRSAMTAKSTRSMSIRTFSAAASGALFCARRSARCGRAGFTSCVIWAHARNPARFFYEAMGGRLVAERSRRMMGDAVPEAAFGWHRLALAERNDSVRRTITRP